MIPVSEHWLAGLSERAQVLQSAVPPPAGTEPQ
jgi:hypothetical protein